MENTTIILILILLFLILNSILLFSLKNISKKQENGTIFNDSLDKQKYEVLNEIRGSKQETVQHVQSSMKDMGALMSGFQQQAADSQDKRLVALNEQMRTSSFHNEQKLENIRMTMENRLSAMQEDNGKRLELMRATVDEKLQKTLEERIGQSFKLVSERLEQVYRGLGEMQNLAVGVGDLKKVLSNVKTRGILGEIQLGAILEEILTKEQYAENIATREGSSERVEFAVKLPGDEHGFVYLPIDAKFPADSYSKLVDAYETGNQQNVDAAYAVLERSMKGFAKSIRDKYIDPPHTTDFGIMFLPFEGLYAEAVRRGMVEILQREYKINIAGPTTMAALLNSLQMGFRTLALQKHSSEVWTVLGAVKTEFEKFGSVLTLTQQRLEQAHTELDKLVGARTRKIQNRLRSVTTMSEESSRKILGIDTLEDDFLEDEMQNEPNQSTLE